MSKRNKKLNEVLNKQVDDVNKINKEKIPNDKTKDIVKKRILKLYFEELRLASDGSIHKFYYNEDAPISVEPNDERVINNYNLNLKKNLETALNIPSVLREFNRLMYVNDNASLLTQDVLINLPRFQKMLRLKQFYKLLVDIGLKMIHNFYWADEINESGYTIEECIEAVTPIIIRLKEDFENKVKDEFLYTQDELNVLKESSIYRYKK